MQTSDKYEENFRRYAIQNKSCNDTIIQYANIKRTLKNLQLVIYRITLKGKLMKNITKTRGERET